MGCADWCYFGEKEVTVNVSERFYQHILAVLFVIGLLVLMLWLAGCSMISMEQGAKGTESYEKITFRGPPKDFKSLDFKFGHDTRLKAGEAATAEQPWADVAGDIAPLLLNVQAYCLAYPPMCATNSQE